MTTITKPARRSDFFASCPAYPADAWIDAPHDEDVTVTIFEYPQGAGEADGPDVSTKVFPRGELRSACGVLYRDGATRSTAEAWLKARGFQSNR